jgi:hypothetical protein
VLPPGSEFPQPGSEINWPITQELSVKPHPLIRVAGLPDELWAVTEQLACVRAAHHLLDLAGVPARYSLDTGTIDCRVLIAVRGMSTLRERLDRISGWHARETGPAGTVGDYCTECGHMWPCATRRMADGETGEDDDA